MSEHYKLQESSHGVFQSVIAPSAWRV